MKVKAPGLRWQKGMPVWRASKSAIESGYPTKTVNLSLLIGNDEAIVAKCKRLQLEMNDFLCDPEFRRWQKGNQEQRPGKIYFIHRPGFVKIGFTIDVRTRFMQLQSNFVEPLKLLGSCDGTPEIEKFIHWMFRSQRLSGEWFEASPHVLAVVESYLVDDKEQIVRKRAPRRSYLAHSAHHEMVSH